MADIFIADETMLRNLRVCLKNNWNVLFIGKHGVGKCLGKGTPVLMYDGSIKKVGVLRELMGKFVILVHTQAHFYYKQIVKETIKNC